MALNARLHPDGADLLPKMLLGIAQDVLHHVVRQRIVCFIMDGDARHRDTPLPSWQVAAVLCVCHRAASRLFTVAIRSCSRLTCCHGAWHQGTGICCQHASPILCRMRSHVETACSTNKALCEDAAEGKSDAIRPPMVL